MGELLQEAGFFDNTQREQWRASLSSKSVRLETLKPPQALHFDREVSRVLDMFHTTLERGWMNRRFKKASILWDE